MISSLDSGNSNWCHSACVYAQGNIIYCKVHFYVNNLCVIGKSAFFEYLVDIGVDPNASDRMGATPLHWACYYSEVKVFFCAVQIKL